MKSSRKRLALLIAYGPETRAFLHSGLAARLAERHEIVILTTRPESQVFWRYRGYEIATAPATARPRGLARLDAMCEHGAGMDATRRTSDHVQRTAGRLFGCDAEWKRLFEDLAIDAVLAASYNSVRTLPALQTARRIGLPIAVVANSWKDVYAKPYAPVRPDVLGLGSARPGLEARCLLQPRHASQRLRQDAGRNGARGNRAAHFTAGNFGSGWPASRGQPSASRRELGLAGLRIVHRAEPPSVDALGANRHVALVRLWTDRGSD